MAMAHMQMTLTLTNEGNNMKTIVITGASRGIGAEIVREFAKEKCNIVINYNKSEEKALNLVKEAISLGSNAIAVKADVSDPEQAKKLIDEAIKVFGSIDVLVNNAGISISGLLIDMTDQQIQSLVQTNLVSVMTCSREVAKYMMSEMKGRIINISSIWGVVGGSVESIYSATKAGIIGFSKAIAKELGPSNITVNVVAPGAIDTEMMACYDEETLATIAEETSVGRIGTPKDVASLVKFLSSDEASYITGQVIKVDGGWFM